MILFTLSCLLFALTIAGFFRVIWWFNVVDFFRLQYACIAFILFCAAFIQFDYISGFICILTIALNMFRIRHFLPRFSSGGIYQNKDVLSINAFKDNTDLDSLRTLIKGANAQVVLIMEMTDNTQHALRDVLGVYTHKLEVPVRDGFRICLFSKQELQYTKITDIGQGRTPFLDAKTEINGKPYQIFCAHPKPCLNKDWHKERKIYFHEIEKIIAQAEFPTLVLGDFNAVPWEDEFQTFLRRTDLKSTLSGCGYKITWPVFFPLAGIPMDHILISHNQAYSNVNIGPFAGSDHYPISLNL